MPAARAGSRSACCSPVRSRAACSPARSKPTCSSGSSSRGSAPAPRCRSCRSGPCSRSSSAPRSCARVRACAWSTSSSPTPARSSCTRLTALAPLRAPRSDLRLARARRDAGRVFPMRLFFPAGLVPLLAFVGAVVFPALFLISLLLPYVCNRIQSHRRHLGLAYGLNTVAFCAGHDRVHVDRAARLASSTRSSSRSCCSRSAPRSWRCSRSTSGSRPGSRSLAAAALLAGCVLTPSGFDRAMMVPRTRPDVRPIRAVRERQLVHDLRRVRTRGRHALLRQREPLQRLAAPADLHGPDGALPAARAARRRRTCC